MKKLIFLCFQDTECNSTQKEINFQFLSQKEYPFDPCTYRGFLFLHFFHCFLKFCVFRIPYVIILKMRRILYFFWFLAVIFGLPGVRLCNVITLKSAFFSKLQNFFKICNFLEFQKIILNTPHSGWCSAVNFWKFSTRFAGFLAVIFTSQWLLASGNNWGLFKAKKIFRNL